MPLLGVFIPIFFCVDGITKVDLHGCLEMMRSEKNKTYHAYEVKIAVFPIQIVQVGKSPYIVLAGNSQFNNESNEFCSNALHACDFSSDSLYGTRFLNSFVDGVSCDSKWIQETICRFTCGNCQHGGITDPNHNIKITGIRTWEVSAQQTWEYTSLILESCTFQVCLTIYGSPRTLHQIF